MVYLSYLQEICPMGQFSCFYISILTVVALSGFHFSFLVELGVVGVVDHVCVSVGIIVDRGIFYTEAIKT